MPARRIATAERQLSPRRRFLAGAGAVAAGGLLTAVSARRAAATRAFRVGRPRQPAGGPARCASTPGRLAASGRVRQPARAAIRQAAVLRRPRASDSGLCARCSSRACGHSSALSIGAPTGCCSRSVTAPSTSPGCWASRRPCPRATSLSSFESPAIDSYHVCLHLACDDEQRLAEIEAALVRGHRLAAALAARPLACADPDLAGDPHRLHRQGNPAAPPARGRHPAGSPVPGQRRCSWASSRGCARTRRARTTSRSRRAPSPRARRCR